MAFDSHVVRLVETAARLVNAHTGTHAQGREVEPPAGEERVRTTAAALAGDGPEPAVTTSDAATLAAHAATWRQVFEAASGGDADRAAALLNPLLRDTGARPQLDPLPGGGWHVHFHGSDDSLAVGWSAGCATGLALALGSDLAGRMGLCDAERCDRVFIDTSRNGTRRFCSTTCQNRTKTAAYRARR